MKQISFKQKICIRKYILGLLQLFISLAKDVYNLESEVVHGIFKNFLETFFLVIQSEFGTALMQNSKKLFYGVDKFLRHFTKKKEICEILLMILT